MADATFSSRQPLKRPSGLQAAIAAGLLVYVILFILTMLPPSQTEQANAARYFSQDEIEKGIRFAAQRRLFFWASTAVQLLFLGFVVFTGFARKLADACSRRLPGPRPQESGAARPALIHRLLATLHWLATVLLVGGFCFVAVELLLLPVRFGRLENSRAWGMTDRSVASWLEDYGKSLAVAAVIGAIVLAGLYLLIRWLPRAWWAVGATASIALALFYAFIMPQAISPLFNTFTPLRDRDLLQRIQALAERAGVPVQNVLVMDASRQGRHTNAYFAGLGSTRQIVLYDTLLRPLHTLPPNSVAAVLGLLTRAASPGPEALVGPVEAGALVVGHRREVVAEIESILAHEIGHWRHDHIVKGILLAGLGAFVGLYLVARILRWAVNRAPFALRSPFDPAGVPLILLLSVVGTWIVMPVENLVSRHFERQADESSLELANHPRAFIASEKRLVRDNISNVAPTPFSVWLFATHPPAIERIQMAEEWRRR